MQAGLIAASVVGTLALVAYDTTHGVAIDASLFDSAPLPKQCVLNGIHAAGFELTVMSNEQIGVAEIGRPAKYWFFADLGNANKVTLYLHQLHEPLQCRTLAEVLPKMRNVAKSIQRSCGSHATIILNEHFINQERCGI